MADEEGAAGGNTCPIREVLLVVTEEIGRVNIDVVNMEDRGTISGVGGG